MRNTTLLCLFILSTTILLCSFGLCIPGVCSNVEVPEEPTDPTADLEISSVTPIIEPGVYKIKNIAAFRNEAPCYLTDLGYPALCSTSSARSQLWLITYQAETGHYYG